MLASTWALCMLRRPSLRSRGPPPLHDRSRPPAPRRRSRGRVRTPARSWSSGRAPPGSPPPTSSARPVTPAPSSRAPTSSAASAGPSCADGYRFDIGGHRFFTKVPEVEALWHEILPDEDFMQRPRSSRIYYQGKFFDYPLSRQGPPQPRCDRGAPLRAVVPLGAHPAAEGPDHPRGLRRRQLRLAPLRALLQDLQHEGVGGAAVGDLRRLGRAADQGHDALDARCGSRSGRASPAGGPRTGR